LAVCADLHLDMNRILTLAALTWSAPAAGADLAPAPGNRFPTIPTRLSTSSMDQVLEVQAAFDDAAPMRANR